MIVEIWRPRAATQASGSPAESTPPGADDGIAVLLTAAGLDSAAIARQVLEEQRYELIRTLRQARNLTIDGQRLLEIPVVSGRTRASRRSNVLLQAYRESSPGRPRLSFSASNRRVPGSLESYASQLPSLANVNGIGKQDDNGRSVC
jgi:hypothetical protein